MNSTLCYIEKDGCYLMLHRTKKKEDINCGKWIGIGGKFEAGESPEDCLYREVSEECALPLTSHRFRGIVTFLCDNAPTEYMHLFTATTDRADFCECDEGVLAWVKKEEVCSLPLWEGDKIFLRLLCEREDFFSLKLVYLGDRLVEAVLDGNKMEI